MFKGKYNEFTHQVQKKWTKCGDLGTEDIKIVMAKLNKRTEALLAFADHFGPLEDNHLLSDEVRACFKLARKALEP
jgi:regulator of sigma D